MVQRVHCFTLLFIHPLQWPHKSTNVWNTHKYTHALIFTIPNTVSSYLLLYTFINFFPPQVLFSKLLCSFLPFLQYFVTVLRIMYFVTTWKYIKYTQVNKNFTSYLEFCFWIWNYNLNYDSYINWSELYLKHLEYSDRLPYNKYTIFRCDKCFKIISFVLKLWLINDCNT